jgi:hypothetical protein
MIAAPSALKPQIQIAKGAGRGDMGHIAPAGGRGRFQGVQPARDLILLMGYPFQFPPGGVAKADLVHLQETRIGDSIGQSGERQALEPFPLSRRN